MMKAHEVHIRHCANLGCEIKISAGVEEKNSRIHKVRLTLFFAGAQVGEKAIGSNQCNTGPSKTDTLTIEEAENAAAKGLCLADGIKAARFPVSWIAISRSKKSGRAQTVPVPVERDFQRSHLRIDIRSAAGNGIEVIVSQCLVQSVTDVDCFDVSVARPPQVMRADTMRKHAANRGGTHQKTILVKVGAGVVFVEVITELRGVAFGKEILHIKICQRNLLMAVVKGVQSAVGVFFKEEEIGSVVLQPIGAEISEDANTGLLLRKQQTAEVAAELLDAGPDRNEVIVRPQIGDLLFCECLL